LKMVYFLFRAAYHYDSMFWWHYRWLILLMNRADNDTYDMVNIDFASLAAKCTTASTSCSRVPHSL
jgi:hypothetical protein